MSQLICWVRYFDIYQVDTGADTLSYSHDTSAQTHIWNAHFILTED